MLSSPGLVLALIGVTVLLGTQLAAVFRVNGPALRDEYHEENRYPLTSVAALALAYFCTFGSEIAVESMLPTFFSDTWGLNTGAAGFAAGSFAFLNIVTRPGGGLLSDLLGSRRRTLIFMLGGLSAGFVVMATLGSAWPVALAIPARCSARSSARRATAPSTR